MLFDTKNDAKEEAHEVAKKLPLNPPNPKQVAVKMETMKGRSGYNIYNINLYGPECKKIEQLFNQFAHMGFKNGYKFQAHITVDKALWDELKGQDNKTAFEVGIEFLPAELRMGDKLIASYKPARPAEWGRDYEKQSELKASENLDLKSMQDALMLSVDLQEKHSKALSFSADIFKSYIQDNPELKEQLLTKHEERAIYHFKDDRELLKIALESGIEKAYEILRKK
jgi:hypothetical protein